MKTKVIINGNPRFNDSFLTEWVKPKHKRIREDYSVHIERQGENLICSGLGCFDIFLMTEVLHQYVFWAHCMNLYVHTTYIEGVELVEISIKSGY